MCIAAAAAAHGGVQHPQPQRMAGPVGALLLPLAAGAPHACMHVCTPMGRPAVLVRSSKQAPRSTTLLLAQRTDAPLACFELQRVRLHRPHPCASRAVSDAVHAQHTRLIGGESPPMMDSSAVPYCQDAPVPRAGPDAVHVQRVQPMTHERPVITIDSLGVLDSQDALVHQPHGPVRRRLKVARGRMPCVHTGGGGSSGSRRSRRKRVAGISAAGQTCTACMCACVQVAAHQDMRAHMCWCLHVCCATSATSVTSATAPHATACKLKKQQQGYTHKVPPALYAMPCHAAG